MEEIIVGVQIGNIILSFKTDPSGSNLKKGLESIRQFMKEHRALFKKYGRDVPSVPSTRNQKRIENLTKSGRAETSVVLRKIEGNLLRRTYFKQAKTTGEVKSELRAQTGVDFTSRKVSQALGILYKKGALSRVGSKGNLRYLEQ